MVTVRPPYLPWLLVEEVVKDILVEEVQVEEHGEEAGLDVLTMASRETWKIRAEIKFSVCDQPFLPLPERERQSMISLSLMSLLFFGNDYYMMDSSLSHFWVAMSMVFFIVATVFTLLKLSGVFGALRWWDLLISFGTAELFAFLVCTKWSNPAIYEPNHCTAPSSSSQSTQHLDCNSGLMVSSEEDDNEHHMCGTQVIGGHVMKIPLIAFQVFLCMHLEGIPQSVRNIPLAAIFLPLFLLQGAGVLLAVSKLVEKVVLLLSSRSNLGRIFSICSIAHDCFAFLHHGSRLLGWWSIDESSREERARLFRLSCSGYGTFSDYPPEVIKRMPRRDLAEKVWRLQAALWEQAEITKYSQREYIRLQNEKVLCRICFEAEIGVVLLPCRHRILCSTCCEKCKCCPLCRVFIEERMPVYDV